MIPNQITSDLSDHMLRHGAKFSDWTVGVTSKVSRLFATFVPTQENWIARDTSDPDLAIDVATYFHSFGCAGASPSEAGYSTIVFAVLKPSEV